MVEKYDKKNGSHKACINPDCDYLHSSDDDDPPGVKKGGSETGDDEE
jgi:DNA topoisomerase-1